MELDGSGQPVKTVSNHADVTTPFLAVFVAGVILILYAIHGRRFTRISAGDYTADSPSPETTAKEYYEQGMQSSEELRVDVANDPAPEPTEARSGVVTTNEGEFSVYALADVPTKVIRDALSQWPNTELPDDLGAFEFASRKSGKGIHPWTLKFRGKKPIVVSYGGRGKSNATVESST